MSLYAHIRLDIRKERVEIRHVEQKVEEQKQRNEETADVGKVA